MDRERVELARLETLDKVIPDEPLVVSTTRSGELIIEAAALIYGDGTLALYLDGVKIREAVVRQPDIGPIYTICAVRAEAGIEYRVAMHVDGVIAAGSPRLRVLTEPPAPEDRLQPDWRRAASNSVLFGPLLAPFATIQDGIADGGDDGGP